jgi:basic membrane protein A
MSSKYLTSVVCNWEILYEEIMKQYLQGNANSVENYWIGLEKEAVELSDFSNEVSDDVFVELEKAKAEILHGKDVFSGMIYDNTGVLRCDEGEIIRDKTLLEQFDWFVEGVEIYEE